MKVYVMQGPGTAGLQETEEPVIGEYEARVDMVVCGVCNSTDRMLKQGTFRIGVKYPSVLGHESVGRVVELGSRVRHLEPGQLVTRCSAYSWERTPLAMHWGGFAQRGVVLDRQAFAEDHPDTPAHDHFPHVAFSAETDPGDVSLAISLSETWSVAADVPMVGRVVAVNGTGIAGLSFVLYARLLGASRVVCVGRRSERLEVARSLGATDVVLAGSEADELFRQIGGAEVILEASGKGQAIGNAYMWVRNGGKLVIYSAPEDDVPINVLGGPRNAQLIVPRPNEEAVLRQVVKMLGAGVIPREHFLSDRFPFEKIDHAFEVIRGGSVVKALIDLE